MPQAENYAFVAKEAQRKYHNIINFQKEGMVLEEMVLFV
jgi:hypothetical protein